MDAGWFRVGKEMPQGLRLHPPPTGHAPDVEKRRAKSATRLGKMPDFRQESLCRTEFFSSAGEKRDVSRSFSRVPAFPGALEILFPAFRRKKTGWKFFVRCPREKNRAGNSFSRSPALGNGLEILFAVFRGNKTGWKISLRCRGEFLSTGKSLLRALFSRFALFLRELQRISRPRQGRGDHSSSAAPSSPRSASFTRVAGMGLAELRLRR
jgi:hypothetical protein